MPLFGPPNVTKLEAGRDVPGLIKALRHKEVGAMAAAALGRLGDPQAVEPLIAALQTRDSAVRNHAARALGQIGDARAVEPLIAALQGGSWDLRGAAVQALGQIGDARALEPLVAAMQARMDERMRQAAAKALGQIGDVRAVEPLVATLPDPYPDVHRAVAEALDRLGWKPGRDEAGALYWIAKRDWDRCVESGAAAVKPLVALLWGGDKLVGQAAARALGQVGDARAVEPLIDALVRGNDAMRQTCAAALGQIGAPAVEPLLRRARGGLALLGQEERTGARAAGPVLRQSLQALGDSWRVHIATALRQLGQAAVEPLIAALQGGDGDLRQAAAWALGLIGHRRAVEPLIAAFWREDIDVRQAVVEALGEIGDPRAVEVLCIALRAPQRDLRQAAVQALDRVGWQPDRGVAGAAYWAEKREWDRCIQIGAAAVEPLVVALGDQDWGVRLAAAGALGQIGGTPAVEPLITALGDVHRDVRRTAAAVLGPVGARLESAALREEIVEFLALALEDQEPDVRQAVAEALGQIGGPPAVEPLVAALRDAGLDLRGVLVQVLDRLDWQPDRGVAGAAYWAEKRGWDRCIQIGAAAVEPLIVSLGDRDVCPAAGQALTRIGAPAAEPLVGLLCGGVPWACDVASGVLEQIGEAAVEPLLAALSNQRKAARRGAALTLVALYRRGQMGEQARQRILAARETMATPHNDHYPPSDCGHTDVGIGIAL